MSSRRYAAPLYLDPKPSRRLISVLFALHCGAVVVLLSLNGWQIAVLVILCILSLAGFIQTHVLRRGRFAVRRLVWNTDGSWTLLLSSHEYHGARLLPSSYIHPELVILNFRIDRWCARSVVLAKDALDGETHRRLRVRLELEASRPAGPTSRVTH
jgi:hypothetical protein